MKLNQLILAAASMTQAGVLAAKTVNWVELGSPSARCCMGMAYDPSTNSTVLFSGSNNAADTWVWRGAWLHVSAATSPPARTNPGFAPDGTGKLVLFGGETSSGAYLNDT